MAALVALAGVGAVASLLLLGSDGDELPPADVVAHGATPDDESDDSLAFERAIRASQTVTVPPGRYVLRARSVRPRAEQTIRCSPGAVLLPAPKTGGDDGIVDSYNRAAIEIVNAPGVVVEGCSIDGNADRAPRGLLFGVNVFGAGSRGVILRDLHIFDIPGDGEGATYGDGIYIGVVEGRPEAAGSPSRVTIDHVTVERTGRQGVAVVAGKEIEVLDSTFRGVPGAGVDVEPNGPRFPAEDVMIKGSHFEGNVLGINVATDTARISIVDNYMAVEGSDPRADNISSAATDGVIRGNTIRRGNHCILVAGISDRSDAGTRTSIAGNDIAECNFGIRSTAREVVMEGNQVHDNVEGGIVVDGQLPNERAADNRVARNVLTNNSAAGLAHPDGYSLSANIHLADSLRSVVTENTIRDDRGRGAAAHGILAVGIPQERSTHVIRDNVITGVSGAPVSSPGDT